MNGQLTQKQFAAHLAAKQRMSHMHREHKALKQANELNARLMAGEQIIWPSTTEDSQLIFQLLMATCTPEYACIRIKVKYWLAGSEQYTAEDTRFIYESEEAILFAGLPEEGQAAA